MSDTKDLLRSEAEFLFSRITEIHDYFMSCTKSSAKTMMEAKMTRLSNLQTQYEELIKRVLAFNVNQVDQKSQYCINDSSFTSMFDVIQDKFLQLTSHSSTSSSSTSTSKPHITHVHASLSANLPVFNGKIESWHNFKALFDSLVHNNIEFTITQKYQILRSHLKHEAEDLVSTLSMDDANYMIAYQNLVDRYDNKRRLINYYINQILNFGKSDDKSHSHFVSVHSNCINAIKQLNLADSTDTLLFCLCYQNLSYKDRSLFDDNWDHLTIPTTQDLILFIQKKAQSSELMSDITQSQTKSFSKKKSSFLTVEETKSSFKSVQPRKGADPVNKKQTLCPVCKNAHKIYSCNEFLQMNFDQRESTIKQLNRCLQCLSYHSGKDCQSKYACKKCNSYLHHTLLHPESSDSSFTQKTVMLTNSNTDSLLSTIEVEVKDMFGRFHKTKAVLDSASQVNAVSSSLLKKLNLKCTNDSTSIFGFGASRKGFNKSVQLSLRSPYQWRTKLDISATVVNEVCPMQPTTQLPMELINQFRNLNLADKTFYQPSKIEILLGSNVFSEILLNENPVIITGSPTAINSKFGYFLCGNIQTKNDIQPIKTSLLTATLENTLKRFWEIEEVDIPKPKSVEEVYVEEHFQKTFSRLSDGRFELSLCFKPHSSPLGFNRDIALKRFYSLERKLLKDPDAKSTYNKFFQEYLDLGHMSVATQEAKYILPHHAVYKPLSSSSKVRAVFDGSCMDDQGHSLNSKLAVGEKLQNELPQIIDSFRSHNIVVCCDIEKMYRNISLVKQDRIFQHIFWRATPHGSLQEYELNTVTYGLTDSPFKALRCIRQLCIDNHKKYPLAVHALKYHSYVDDVISGHNDISSATQLKQELIDILASASFKVKKWSSNSPELLSSIEEQDVEKLIIFSDDSVGIKILGLIWNPHKDVFSYQVQPFEGTVTKRSVLSYIARIFDCNGFLAPVVLKAKLFIQQFWRKGYNWNDEIPDPLNTQWLTFVSEFPLLSQITIPRKIFFPSAEFRLVGVCDASNNAMACSVYIHVTLENECQTFLLRSKTKVAPLKPITIPRAELVAALLLAKLIKSIMCDGFTFKIKQIFYFTDSEIVLAWLKTEPSLLQTFVCHRVVQILELSNPNQWSHISTKENSSDISSRGANPSQLLDFPLYWNGPSFCSLPVNEWPRNNSSQVIDISDLPEVKKHKTVLITSSSSDYLIEVITRCSTLCKMKRVFAYWLRYKQIIKYHIKITGRLSVMELNSALVECIKITQYHYYKDEINLISANKSLTSSLRKLSPFLSNDGVLMVGGRLEFSSLPATSKHPMLIHAKSHLALLICNYYHTYSGHASIATVQSLIQLRFWIPHLRSLLKRCAFNCIRCFRLQAKPKAPFMSPLPPARVQISPPFYHTGLDFCGFFEVKESNRRNAKTYKAYAAIFICFATKAVHFEIVSSLSTDAFIASFNRFSSRRGLPHTIYCDRGTNFIGASRQLKEIQQWIKDNHDIIFSSLAAKQVNFKFNCPSAPSMGGLWEGNIRIAKNHLYRQISSTKLTYEELETVFVRIEAIMNSRPLTYLTATPDDGTDYLSPGHFLIGRPILSFPEYLIREDISLTSRWQRLSQMVQSFWNRWSKEYLHTLISRNKWTTKSTNISSGQLVLISDIKTSPLSWPLGRVIEVYPGQDNVIRVVKVKTLNGNYIRPVNKIVVLPVH